MNLLDDPRLTAHALGELPPDEASEIAAVIAADPAAAAAYADIAATTAALRALIAREPTASLEAPQRDAIERRLRRSGMHWPLVCAGLAATAACISVMAVWSRPARSPHPAEPALAERSTRAADPAPQPARSLAIEPSGVEGLVLPAPQETPIVASVGDQPQEAVADEWEMPRGSEASYAAEGSSGTLVSAPNDRTASHLSPAFTEQPKNRAIAPRDSADASAAMFGHRAVDAEAADAVRHPVGGIDPGCALRYRRLGAADPVDPGETYDHPDDNRPTTVRLAPLSTFSIDVDTASYANVRRFLLAGQQPPRDAVRIEELINYFPYHYAPPRDGRPFSVDIEIAACPWAPAHRLARIGLKGKDVARGKRAAANLVFLIDVSGSMAPQNRLPLVKLGLGMLVDELTAEDHVAIITYAGSSGVALRSTSGADKKRIHRVLDGLTAGGSTNGGSGVEMAYAAASEGFVTHGVNRVILATDGDWNVGLTDRSELVRLIERKATDGVFLSVLGVGMGNLKDATMEQLADHGNGNYAYLDSVEEAHKVLIEQMNGTLVTIAKDVKLQVEFNPARVASYRLIGYENRMLARRDFTDDRADAGEMGAGHAVTALYEIVPSVDDHDPTPRRYAHDDSPIELPATDPSEEMFAVNVRYKAPEADRSTWFAVPARDAGTDLPHASEDFRFAAAVAEFGLIMRQAPYRGSASLRDACGIAQHALGDDPAGHRQEFIDLMHRAIRRDSRGDE